MAKTNSLHENATIEGVELFIRETLLKGENVIIPDFGHLELKSLGERRTVFFKPAESSDSFLHVMSVDREKEKKDFNVIYKIISDPLKEGKIVNLPQIGVFRPVKRENGKVHISFTPSFSFRKLLNGEETEEVKEIIKEKKEKEEIPDIPESKDEAQKDVIITTRISPEKSNEKSETTVSAQEDSIASKFRTNLPNTQRSAQIGEVLVPQDDDTSEKSKLKNISKILLLIVVVIAVVVVVASNIYSRLNKKIEERTELIVPSDSTLSLPALAEQHYGHSAFWIYIYEANKDKLKSPINIPKNISLVIPDLKTEYDVDVTDSMEIRRANIFADIILNKEKIITNK